jgi:histidine triad (HIT) family protein
MNDCLFCRIAKKEVPSQIVYEDERVIAFRDLYPVAPIHVLIVPKHHTENVLGLIASERAGDDMQAIGKAIEKIADLEGVNERGFRLIVNTGKEGGQSIGHTHIHLIGGKTLGHGLIGTKAEKVGTD